ncbi:MAG TPA: HAD-IIB family hydrolase [Candidatus Paceibacterota bacterium]
MKKLWFKRKAYGWGWYPAAWQGWLVLAVYVAVMAFFASTVDNASPDREVFFMLVLPFLILTTALIRICYATGEKPRWQWGVQKEFSLIAFDLDGTLAESKMSLDNEMAGLIADLLSVKKVAIISGAGIPQLEKQVLSHLPSSALLSNLYLLPTNGAALLSHNGTWKTEYENALTAEEKAKIFAAFETAFTQTGYVRPTDANGVIIEDRGTQITFSGLGSTAPTELKALWDPHHEKRTALQHALKKQIPEFSISIGGMTSIDVTKGSVDKAYGIKSLLKHTHLDTEQLLFVGDALFKGGNDAAVLRVGVAVAAVKGVSETKGVIRKLIEGKL